MSDDMKSITVKRISNMVNAPVENFNKKTNIYYDMNYSSLTFDCRTLTNKYRKVVATLPSLQTLLLITILYFNASLARKPA